MSLENDYRVLDLELGASLQEVKRSYRELAMVWHPDRFTGQPKLLQKANEKLTQINLAYERICKRSIDATSLKPPSDEANSTGTWAQPSSQSSQPEANTLGMKFVPVAGTGVYFCIWETRVQDYAAYASSISGVDDSWKTPGFTQANMHPVVKVSWEGVGGLAVSGGKVIQLLAFLPVAVDCIWTRKAASGPRCARLRCRPIPLRHVQNVRPQNRRAGGSLHRFCSFYLASRATSGSKKGNSHLAPPFPNCADSTMARIAVLRVAGSFGHPATTSSKSGNPVPWLCGAPCEGEAVSTKRALGMG